MKEPTLIACRRSFSSSDPLMLDTFDLDGTFLQNYDFRAQIQDATDFECPFQQTTGSFVLTPSLLKVARFDANLGFKNLTSLTIPASITPAQSSPQMYPNIPSEATVVVGFWQNGGTPNETVLESIHPLTLAQTTLWANFQTDPNAALVGCGLSRDGQTWYYREVGSGTILALDLATGVSTSFITSPASHGPSVYGTYSLYELPDGTFLVLYESATTLRIMQYNAGGSPSGIDVTLTGIFGTTGVFAPEPDGGAVWVLGLNVASTANVLQRYLIPGGTLDVDEEPPDATADYVDLLAARGAVPVPIQPPLAPLTPCVPEVSATNGGTGASGCNDGGVGWESDYAGPFDDPPEHNNPAAGELLTNARGIQLWTEHRHVDYPSDVVTTYRRSFVELGHLPTYQGGRKTEGLKAIGAVTHSLSNLRDAAALDISYADQVDRLYRGLLETQTIEMDEYRVKGATAARIAAGLPPRVFIRALVQQAPTTSSPMEATITAVDELFAIYGPLGPQRMFPSKTFGDCGAAMPDLTPDTKAQVIPVLIGEMSDKGADPQPKGACIGFYCGKFDLTGSGIAVAPDTPGYTLAALVAALQASVTANTTDADWGGCIGHADSAVLQAMGTVPNDYTRLASVIGYADLDALLDGSCGGGTTPAPDDTEWGFIAFGLGEFFRYIQVFGSNMGGGVAGVTADRVLLDLMARSDILVPGYIWPFVDNFVTFTNPDTGEVFEISGIWARGQLLEDHIKGVINITANCIGRMGNAGLPLMHAHTIEQAFYEDCLLGDWTSGPIADDTTYPQFEDDPTVPKVNSASFIARQAWLDAAYGAPFLLTLYATAAQPLAYWHEEFCNATESFTGQNQDGQIVKWGLNPSADPTTAMRIDHVPHIFGKVQRTNVDLENTSVGSAGWDADKQRFAIGPVSRPSTAGIARYKNHVKFGPELKSMLLRDEVQHTWILDRRLERLEFGMTKYVVSGTIGFWDVDVGDLVQLTTIEGTGAVGFVDRPCIVLEQGLDFATWIATLTVWDVEGLLV